MKIKTLDFDNKKWKWWGSCLTLLPLAMAVCAAQPGQFAGAISAGCLLLLWWPMERAGTRITGVLLILLGDLALRHPTAQGLVAALLFLVLTGELLLLASQKDDPGVARLLHTLRPPQTLYAGIALGGALLMTLRQGSGYFELGAHGAGGLALLKSYGQLGFHPNWRAVLFSTVMLLVLIAYPRKCKSLSRVLPPGFVGVLLTTGLNCLLNPVRERTTVAEFAHKLVPQVPFFGRAPIAALSMLLIYAAWEEVPWRHLAACMRKPPRALLVCAVAMLLFFFDLLWVFAALAIAWGAMCALRALRARK
ncbi:MAG: hypothetical protein LBB50_02145 [Oscillospiraceae bacterium]|jgi:MFS superfamily sulfate permease-like transporter|nr:hypothetical protein [Oscillospiraceae bacterium]